MKKEHRSIQEKSEEIKGKGRNWEEGMEGDHERKTRGIKMEGKGW